MAEYFETSSKKGGRGLGRESLALIEAMREISEATQPITGRGVGYQLFTRSLIPSMKEGMPKVYRLLKIARERGYIPWEWIVDETRGIEKVPTWNNPAAFARCAARSYRRDFWKQQPVRCEVWAEKGTVRGVLQPVLDEYGVGFRVMHGFGSATEIYGVSQHQDGRALIVFYVGDYDPSGMCMSEKDLPKRLSQYGGDHIALARIALTKSQARGLPSFSVEEKKTDKRYDWFKREYGHHCWELDAMNPNDLRACVEEAIKELIEPEAWDRCMVMNRAEQQSIQTILDGWKDASPLS